MSICVVFVCVVTGCGAPCNIDSECPDDQHCAETTSSAGDDDASGVCARLCTTDIDCEYGDVCHPRGKCTVGKGPRITWVSPSEQAALGDAFEVEVDVTFVGREVHIRLDVDATNPGSECGGFSPQELTLPGVLDDETTHRVVFRDVKPAGISFALEVAAFVTDDEVRFARQTLRGPRIDPPLGFVRNAPSPGLVAEPAISVPLDLAFSPPASAVWARVFPEVGAPTPLRLLGEDVTTLRGIRHPVARGPQTLVVDVTQSGQTRQCRLHLDATSPNPPGFEVALTFESVEASDLDLWIFGERIDADLSLCTAANFEDPCVMGDARPGLSVQGEERVGLRADDGVYGIAVVPGAVSDPVSAMIRLARDGNQLSWLGPTTMTPATGMVWLAARVYIVNGAVTVEPLDVFADGLPTLGPSSW